MYADNQFALIGRKKNIFSSDIHRHREKLDAIVQSGSFLVIGGAGTIGQAVVKELFKRSPKKLYVVDISENNLVELVRDIRSSLGYIEGDFRTFALDCGSPVYKSFFEASGPFDYVLNLSALKHVRSEKDPYTLMRLLQVNIVNTETTLRLAASRGAEKYFSVSTDKAANPVNVMGASKRVMELVLNRARTDLATSTARFANVAFSDGSLLHGFNQRLLKRQPISAPSDVKRYFVTQKEAGELCLMAALLGTESEIFFPKYSKELPLITFSSIAEKYLRYRGYEPCLCQTEDEARTRVDELEAKGKWPCYFFDTDTTGEKPYEEFYTPAEEVDLDRFTALGVVKQGPLTAETASKLDRFFSSLTFLSESGRWTKKDLLDLFIPLIDNFEHMETGKYLDNRM